MAIVEKHQHELAEYFQQQCPEAAQVRLNLALAAALIAYLVEKAASPDKAEAACLLYHLSQSGALREGMLQGAALPALALSAVLLTDVDLQQAQLQNADLHKSVFVNTNFNEAMLDGARLAEAVVRNGSFQKASLAKADLSLGWFEADFGQAAMDGANLAGTVIVGNLSKASLRGANLEKCWLRHANLRGVDFTNANLKGVVLEIVDYDATTIMPDGTRPKSGELPFMRFKDENRRDFWSPGKQAAASASSSRDAEQE
jgi:uncharacterized protein YjbI with pentapeptide repeats